MRRSLGVVTVLAIATSGPAQNCVYVASGCPCLPFTRPSCQNTVPLGAIGAGNPNFALSADVFNACVPAGSPLLLIMGFPGPTVPIPLFLLDPAFGGSCSLGMPTFALAQFAGVSGSLTNPWLPLPIPPGLAGAGHVVTAQIVILGGAGFGLSGSTGVVL